MQYMSCLWPNHLPKRMEQYRDKYEHHWIVEMSSAGVDEARTYLDNFFAKNEGNYFKCTKEEGDKAILHRFVAGGSIGRYHVMKAKELGPIMTIDVAFPHNEKEWFETLPHCCPINFHWNTRAGCLGETRGSGGSPLSNSSRSLRSNKLSCNSRSIC